jgi:hypothetical protein
MKYRIVTKTLGIHTYYRAEIKRMWFLFEYWCPFWACTRDGSVYYGECGWNKDIEIPKRYIKEHQELFDHG